MHHTVRDRVMVLVCCCTRRLTLIPSLSPSFHLLALQQKMEGGGPTPNGCKSVLFGCVFLSFSCQAQSPVEHRPLPKRPQATSSRQRCLPPLGDHLIWRAFEQRHIRPEGTFCVEAAISNEKWSSGLMYCCAKARRSAKAAISHAKWSSGLMYCCAKAHRSAKAAISRTKWPSGLMYCCSNAHQSAKVAISFKKRLSGLMYCCSNAPSALDDELCVAC